MFVAFTEEKRGCFLLGEDSCRGLTLHTTSNSPSGRTSAHLLLFYEGHHHGRLRLRCHPRNWRPHHLEFTSSNSSSKGVCFHFCSETFGLANFSNHKKALLASQSDAHRTAILIFFRPRPSQKTNLLVYIYFSLKLKYP